DDASMAREGVPERVEVRSSAVRALAVARPVPEGDAAVTRLLQRRAQPAQLGRVGSMRRLRVQAEDLPAGYLRLEPGRQGLALAPVPVAVVALEAVVPLVIADG